MNEHLSQRVTIVVSRVDFFFEKRKSLDDTDSENLTEGRGEKHWVVPSSSITMMMLIGIMVIVENVESLQIRLRQRFTSGLAQRYYNPDIRLEEVVSLHYCSSSRQLEVLVCIRHFRHLRRVVSVPTRRPYTTLLHHHHGQYSRTSGFHQQTAYSTGQRERSRDRTQLIAFI